MPRGAAAAAAVELASTPSSLPTTGRPARFFLLFPRASSIRVPPD